MRFLKAVGWILLSFGILWAVCIPVALADDTGGRDAAMGLLLLALFFGVPGLVLVRWARARLRERERLAAAAQERASEASRAAFGDSPASAKPRAAAKAERRCDYCGRILPWGAAKCPGCGADV